MAFVRHKLFQRGERMKRGRNTKVWLWLGGIVLFVIAVLFHLTTALEWGVTVSDDSVFYLSAAKNLLQGDGLSWISGDEYKPLTHYPPLYPIALSALGFILGDVNIAATYIAAILFGINTLLIVLMVYDTTRELLFAFVGGIIILVSPIFLEVHMQAMSEPLYFTCSLLSLFFIMTYIQRQKWKNFFLAAITASLAFLTRYIGISVVVTGAMAILLLQRGSLRRKLSLVALYSVLAIFLNLLWYARNYFLTGNLTNRVLIFHPIAKEKVVEAVSSVTSWLLPTSMSFYYRVAEVVIVVLISLMGFVFLWQSNKRKNRGFSKDLVFPAILFLHAVIYLLLLIFSLAFFDASTHFSNRILFPIYMVGVILALVSAPSFFKGALRPQGSWVAFAGKALLATLLGIYLLRSLDLTHEFQLHGGGYTSEAWRNSAVVSKVKEVGADVHIFSNQAFSLQYLTGNPASWIPEESDPVKAEERGNYDDLVLEMHEQLQQQNSALVLFYPSSLSEPSSMAELGRGLVLVYAASDGVICVSPENLETWVDSHIDFLPPCFMGLRGFDAGSFP